MHYLVNNNIFINHGTCLINSIFKKLLQKEKPKKKSFIEINFCFLFLCFKSATSLVGVGVQTSRMRLLAMSKCLLFHCFTSPKFFESLYFYAYELM